MRRRSPSGPRARSPLAMARKGRGSRLGSDKLPHPCAARNREASVSDWRRMRAAKSADRPCATMAARRPKQTRKETSWKIPKAESQRRIFQGKSPATLAQIAPCARSAHTPARWPRGRRGSAVRASPRAGRWWTPTTGASRRWRWIPSRRSRSPAFAREPRCFPWAPTAATCAARFARMPPSPAPAKATCPWREIAPAELVNAAASLAPEGNIGLAFTYNEPLVGLESVRDTARLAHELRPGERAGVQRLRERRPAT